jgi:phosphate transport system protein
MIENPAMISNSLKMNYVSKSLERVADHATNIAEMVIFMVQGKNVRHTKNCVASASSEVLEKELQP